MNQWSRKTILVLAVTTLWMNAGAIAAPATPSGTPVQINIPACTDANLKAGDYCMYIKGNVRKVSTVLSVDEKGDKSIHFLTQQELVAFARGQAAAAASPSASPVTSPAASPNASVSASPAASPSASVSASPAVSPAASPAAPVKDDSLAGCKKSDATTILCPDGTYEKTTKVNELMMKDLINKTGASTEASPSPAGENTKTGN